MPAPKSAYLEMQGEYPDSDSYIRKMISATLKMIERGFLLPEDAEEIIFRAMDMWREKENG